MIPRCFRMLCFSLTLLACAFSVGALPALASSPVQWKEEPKLEEVFAKARTDGTFVLYDIRNRVVICHNRPRAETRYIPASTFKIPNTLIGLATGAVSGLDEVLPYGGGKQPLKEWARNMNLRDAIKVSNVPIYQELARRIGFARMHEEIRRLDYGNGRTGSEVDRFWLDGPLEITAIEQMEFLTKLVQKELPYPPEIQEAVRGILMTEQGRDWKIFSKTGLIGKTRPNVAWWVGWLEKGEDIFVFVLNLDVTPRLNYKRRIDLGKECLKVCGSL